MDAPKIMQRMRAVRITVEMLGDAILIDPNVPIDDLLKSWGHNRAPGCVVCDTVQMLVADDFRVFGPVTVQGPPS